MFIAFKDARIRITSIQVFHTHSTHQRYSWTKHLPTNKDLRNVSSMSSLRPLLRSLRALRGWRQVALLGRPLRRFHPQLGRVVRIPGGGNPMGEKMSCHQWWLFIGLMFGHVWRVLVVINVYTISLDGFKWLVQISIYIYRNIYINTVLICVGPNPLLSTIKRCCPWIATEWPLVGLGCHLMWPKVR